MSRITETLAQQAVAAFRAELGDALNAEIGESQFRRLELLVAEAVAAGLRHASERVDDLGRSLRAETADPSDGLEL